MVGTGQTLCYVRRGSVDQNRHLHKAARQLPHSLRSGGSIQPGLSKKGQRFDANWSSGDNDPTQLGGPT